MAQRRPRARQRGSTTEGALRCISPAASGDVHSSLPRFCCSPSGRRPAPIPQTTIDPKSGFADSAHGVYTIVFWLAAIVFVVVLAMALAFSLAFRERPGREAMQFHGNTRLEVLWTLIPVVIVVISKD